MSSKSFSLLLTTQSPNFNKIAIKTVKYGVKFLISYLSQFMSLQPGDIISTGTPPGVGMGMKPQVFLKRGDRMVLGVEGLGEQTQKTV